jgi:hypothetical protein
LQLPTQKPLLRLVPALIPVRVGRVQGLRDELKGQNDLLQILQTPQKI